MDRRNVVARMLEVIPDTRNEYEALMQWYEGEDPGLHVVMGDVLNPYLIALLSSDAEGETLRTSFDFLEEMALSEDAYVQEVLVVTVLEGLGGSPAALGRARKLMRPATRRLSEELEEGWRRFHESSNSPGTPVGG